MRLRAAVAVMVAAVWLAGCASPGDVAAHRETVLANNARALADNDRDLVVAQQWDTRVLGLPASGALTLAIVAIVGVVAVVGSVLVYRYQVRKAANLAPCAVCGASYRDRTKL